MKNKANLWSDEEVADVIKGQVLTSKNLTTLDVAKAINNMTLAFVGWERIAPSLKARAVHLGNFATGLIEELKIILVEDGTKKPLVTDEELVVILASAAASLFYATQTQAGANETLVRKLTKGKK